LVAILASVQQSNWFILEARKPLLVQVYISRVPVLFQLNCPNWVSYRYRFQRLAAAVSYLMLENNRLMSIGDFLGR